MAYFVPSVRQVSKSRFVDANRVVSVWRRLEADDQISMLGEGVVFTRDVDGEVGDGAVVSGTGEGIAERKEVASVVGERSQMEGLGPLIEPCESALSLKIAAGVLVG